MPGELVQFLGSLAAILVLAGIAYLLKLGNQASIGDETRACALAQEVDHGFTTDRCAVDRQGRAAILLGQDGRIMILRLHGAHSVGRILDQRTDVRQENDILTVDVGEKRFGIVRLDLADAAAWAKRIEALKAPQDA